MTRDYANELHGKEREYPTARRYSFDYFTNGKPISATLRRAHASRLDESGHVEQPFDTNEGVYAFAKQNGLLFRNDTPAKRKTFKDIGAENAQVKVMNLLLRLALRTLGLGRYFDLMRHMTHISSIRNQAEVFKMKQGAIPIRDDILKVLISGGAGFIGYHLSNRLRTYNASLRILDNLSPQIHGELPDNLDWLIHPQIKYIRGSVVDRDTWKRALGGVDVAVHPAAETGTGQLMY